MISEDISLTLEQAFIRLIRESSRLVLGRLKVRGKLKILRSEEKLGLARHFSMNYLWSIYLFSSYMAIETDRLAWPLIESSLQLTKKELSIG